MIPGVHPRNIFGQGNASEADEAQGLENGGYPKIVYNAENVIIAYSLHTLSYGSRADLFLRESHTSQVFQIAGHQIGTGDRSTQGLLNELVTVSDRQRYQMTASGIFITCHRMA